MKRIMLFSLIAAIFAIGCGNKEEPLVGVLVETNVELRLLDSEGNDLLNPSHADTYHNDRVRVYALIDGKKVLYHDEMMRAQYGYKWITPEGLGLNEYWFRLFPSQVYDSIELNPTCYIHWNDVDVDTVESVIEKRGYSMFSTKVWYNGELMWEESKGEKHVLVIEK